MCKLPVWNWASPGSTVLWRAAICPDRKSQNLPTYTVFRAEVTHWCVALWSRSLLVGALWICDRLFCWGIGKSLWDRCRLSLLCWSWLPSSCRASIVIVEGLWSCWFWFLRSRFWCPSLGKTCPTRWSVDGSSWFRDRLWTYSRYLKSGSQCPPEELPVISPVGATAIVEFRILPRLSRRPRSRD